MESRSTRDHGCHLNQLRPPWSYGFSLASGISWPPQRLSSSWSYTCGYGKREFRSAQALGGHMNVHRRERAKLRQFSSPNPTHRPAPPLPNLNFSTAAHFPGDGASTTAATPSVYSFFSTAAGATAKAALELNLEWGVGGLSDGALDLELRLGCS